MPPHQPTLTSPQPPVSELAPTLSLLTRDDLLGHAVEEECRELGVSVQYESGGAAVLIDPGVGPELIRTWSRADSTVETAVIRSASAPAAVLLALRLCRGTLIEDPRRSPERLRAYLSQTLVLEDGKRDRRAYPRAQGSGVRVLDPPGAELVDISPYGARIRLPPGDETPVAVRLRVQFDQRAGVDEIHCQVVERLVFEGFSELRLRFAKLAPESQQELLRIAKADVLCRTIAEVHGECEAGDVDGYRRVIDVRTLATVLSGLAQERATVQFATLVQGRPQVGTVTGADAARRLLTVAMAKMGAQQSISQRVCYSVAGAQGSWLMDGHVVGVTRDEVTLTFPSACLAAEHRAQDRLQLGLASSLRVRVAGQSAPVTDLSARGLSFFVREGHTWATQAARLEVELDLGDGTVHRELLLVRNARSARGGLIVGGTFVDLREAPPPVSTPLVCEELSASAVAIREVDQRYPSEKVRFLSSGGRRVVGLWTETRHHGGPCQVVVVPPAWAKTKESMTLLAQFLCATFDQAGRHLAVLRFDYTEALGESERSPQFDTAGHETLGLTMTGCVEAIHAAVNYAGSRLPEAALSLVGMSFSGPLALRAAVENNRVSALFEVMGASDIQDLVRRATGGIDYVNRYRAGLRTGQQNVLGILSDTDRWVGDAIRAELVYLQSTQADAAKLSVPLIWVHGRHDAFVDEDRIRSVLEFSGASERQLHLVPCGHVPTKTAEALLSYVPVASWLLRRVGAPLAYAAPSEALLAEATQQEWATAPRSGLPSPRNYWRDYMLGHSEGSLGFDVLTMTREYRELMRLQTALLELATDGELHDLGGGLGHSLGYVRRGVRVHLYDLVPELLEQAQRRANDLGVALHTHEWDAEAPSLPEPLRPATHILMSLFLSSLSNPASVLARVAAHVSPGTKVVASTMRPDADLSGVYANLLRDIAAGDVPAPPGSSRPELVKGVRDYMSSAAWLLRLADEGTFHFFEESGFAALFEQAGFEVLSLHRTFGSPERALVLVGEKR